MSGLIIRRAAAGDAEMLIELYTRHLTTRPPSEPQNPDLWRQAMLRFEADENYHLLVGEQNGCVVSSVTLVVVENLTHNMHPYALIENVVTHANHRSKGYASALMTHAVGLAAKAGCYKVMLLTGSRQDGTLRFYERCGFNRNDKLAFIRWL